MSQIIFDQQPRAPSRPGAPHVSNSNATPLAAATYQPPPPNRMATGTLSPPPRIGAATMHTSAVVACSYDAHLTTILDTDLPPGESAFAGFARKERELGEAFAALPIMDQRALHTRFSIPRAGDALAAKFGRLTADRRGRLLTFLADARRRAAHASAAKGR